jgi:predicted AAA+ superfamily ATPase
VRQCGKTTLLKTLPESWRRFDMERGIDRQQVITDPDLFLRLHPRQVAIDEAQLVPELFPALRVAIDRDRRSKGRFVLTGSSSPNLVTRISESLAGRVALIELSPLTIAEAWELPPSPLYATLAQRDGIPALMAAAVTRLSVQQISQYWFHGGYPEPWLSNDEVSCAAVFGTGVSL